MTATENVLRTAQHWQRLFALNELPCSLTVKYNKAQNLSYIKIELFDFEKYHTLIFYPDSAIEKAEPIFAKVQELYNNLKQ